jgi:hypothetical protein
MSLPYRPKVATASLVNGNTGATIAVRLSVISTNGVRFRVCHTLIPTNHSQTVPSLLTICMVWYGLIE